MIHVNCTTHIQLPYAAHRVYVRRRYRHHRRRGCEIWEARAYALVDFSRRWRHSKGTDLPRE